MLQADPLREEEAPLPSVAPVRPSGEQEALLRQEEEEERALPSLAVALPSPVGT